MNWDALSTVADLVGAVAIIATLIYLAIQIKQNTESVTTSTYDSVISGFNSINVEVVSNPEVADIFLRGNADPASLSEADAVRYAFLLRSWSNQWLKLLRLNEQGTLSDDDWQRFAIEAKQALSTPGGKLFREENGVFRDLYSALDQLDLGDISQVRLGGSRISE